jgi:hypothetical protein
LGVTMSPIIYVHILFEPMWQLLWLLPKTLYLAEC